MSALLPPDLRRIDVHRLAGEALKAWGIEATRIETLKVRENCVLRITRADGRLAAMRIHRPGYRSHPQLQSEFDWLNALYDCGIQTPRAIPSSSGRLFEIVCSASVEGDWVVDLFEWVAGAQLGSVEHGIDGDDASVGHRAFALGKICGRLHDQAMAWQRPAGFIRASWDASGLVGEQPLWGRFWEYPGLARWQARLLTRVRDALRKDLGAYGTERGDFGLIHGDLVPENLLTDGDRLVVIDFDDAGEGWHLFDIATSLYFLRRRPYFDAVFERLIAGYRAVRPLSDHQLELLPLFIAARATTYIGWMHTRSSPDDPHPQESELIESACSVAVDYLCDRRRL
jgi:Ser/Thr protein kinase RdoA (MazF antagonist)